jgi:hypothetical protein
MSVKSNMGDFMGFAGQGYFAGFYVPSPWGGDGLVFDTLDRGPKIDHPSRGEDPMAQQLELFVLEEQPANAPPVLASPGNRPYGKGRPCTPFPPGTGPHGETCGGCLFAERQTNYNGNKHWIKCSRMRNAHTGGTGTDVKARWESCEAWQPRDVSLLRFAVVGIYEAHVYLRKGDRYNEAMDWKGGPIATVADLWVWWDWHHEHCWRTLRPPGFRSWTGGSWQAIEPE